MGYQDKPAVGREQRAKEKPEDYTALLLGYKPSGTKSGQVMVYSQQSACVQNE